MSVREHTITTIRQLLEGKAEMAELSAIFADHPNIPVKSVNISKSDGGYKVTLPKQLEMTTLKRLAVILSKRGMKLSVIRVPEDARQADKFPHLIHNYANDISSYQKAQGRRILKISKA